MEQDEERILSPEAPARNASSIADAGGENREDMLKKIEKPEEVHPILAQKLSGVLQTPVVKTEHTLENITKAGAPTGAGIPTENVEIEKPKIDPYREIPE